ncbi:MAG: thioredoxin family protein [Bacteroidia bacterium]|nr:thioredoxin family protein [Bacteroidia bacterium]
MKGLLNLIALLLCGSLLANSNTSRIEFINGSLGLAIEKAGHEGKLLFVEFGAQWCMPCKFMEENTFQDQEVVEYMSTNYVPVKIDIDDFDGFAYKQKYNVEALPTFIIFDSRGEVVERYQQSMAPSNLLKILQKHDVPTNRKKIKSDLSSYEIAAQLHEAKKDKYNISPSHDAQEEQEVQTIGTIVNTQISNEPSKAEEIESSEEESIESHPATMHTEQIETTAEEYLWTQDEVYEFIEEPDDQNLTEGPEKELLVLEDPKITLYTVQVGTFSSKTSTDEFVKATSAIFVEDTHIFENHYQNHSSYEVCLGAFASEQSAQIYLNRLELLNIPGKVKTIYQ